MEIKFITQILDNIHYYIGFKNSGMVQTAEQAIIEK
jgi:hypothetical protein